MRKSRRHGKQTTGKRFSRKRVLKGGSFGTDDNLILIGYANKTFTPIIVPINSTWAPKPPPHGFSGSLIKPGISAIVANGNFPFVILSQLYKLPNIRNLDLFQDFASRAVNGAFIDDTFTTILPFKGYTPGNMDKQEYYNYLKPQIIEIERKYPGLFKPIFLTPEETQKEIKRVEAETPMMPKEVQMEERISDKLSNAVSDIVDVIKSSVASGVNENYDLITSLQNEVRQLRAQLDR
jgi:hypothetical protein